MQKRIANQAIEFNKAVFDNAFKTISFMQDQAEKFAFQFMEKAPWVQEDAKQSIKECAKVYKKGREDFKKFIDDHCRKALETFVATGVSESQEDEKQK
jgi:hypothetical protein